MAIAILVPVPAVVLMIAALLWTVPTSLKVAVAALPAIPAVSLRRIRPKKSLNLAAGN